MKHTPSPWIVESDGSSIAMAGEVVIVAPAPDQASRDEQKANARLIAAAPELLDACEQAVQWLEGWASAEPYVSKLRAAIAKATGEA